MSCRVIKVIFPHVSCARLLGLLQTLVDIECGTFSCFDLRVGKQVFSGCEGQFELLLKIGFSP
uniref:Secreted protein n=1 Tax=Heterorhabditis bacteriophora TaxID=37862 RepID=A0A1I7WAB0_HETBA